MITPTNIFTPVMIRKLSEIQVGKAVIVKSFTDNQIFLKLMEMGCLPGEIIQVEKVAPLKDPISIKVSGYVLSLRINEAETILVEEI